LSEKVLPPEEKHPDFSVINGHREILSGQISASLGMNLQRVLLKSTEKPYLSEKLFVLSKSEPEPPALNS
jgi:hypothetical protein